MISPAMISRMAAIAGLHPRRRGPSVFLQARVDPAVRDRARRGAEARGISVSRYMQELILADELADDAGAPELPYEEQRTA